MWSESMKFISKLSIQFVLRRVHDHIKFQSTHLCGGATGHYPLFVAVLVLTQFQLSTNSQNL